MMFDQDRAGLARAYVAVSVRPAEAVRLAAEWVLPRAGCDWSRVGLQVPLYSLLSSVPALGSLQRLGVRVSGERRTASSSYATGPLIVYYPSLQSLAEAEEIDSATALVVVGADHQLRPWISAFRPERLAGDRLQPGEPVVSDPVTWQAMQSFTNSINSSTGLKDPRDRSRVTDGLQKLRTAGHSVDPDELMAAALRMNWRGSAAWDLRTLAREINAGGAKRTRETYREDIVQVWCSAAAAATGAN